jgi:xylan 1,4-beta-xylosidase
LDFWTPNVNPFRDPRWSRGHETPGEDAFRNGRYAAAFVHGMEGNGWASTKKVIATCKHFAAYDLENTGSTTRFNFDAKVTLQDLVEYYLPPFQQCARDAHVGSVMCSYNAVNGVPACANAYLMDTILRTHWNWTGDNQYIVSDCDAVYYLCNAIGGHRYKASQAAAVAAAFEAGTDNICWATDGAAPNPSAAFSQKLFSQATLDKMLVRQYQGLIRAGMFDGPQGAYRNLGAFDVNTANAKALALQAAQEGIVLLKNDGILPLAAPAGSGDAASSLAMIGFWASKADEMLGGYSGTPPFNHDPVTAAKQLGFSVIAASGPIAQASGDTGAATAAAKNAHTILYFGGIDNSVEKESSDSSNIAWPAGQVAQIRALAALNKPVVVVKMGTHVDDTPLLSMSNVRAILWAGYSGQDGGTAVMNVLLGRPAPAGRLPITMYPSSCTQDASMINMALRPSSNYPGRAYRWYDKAVFPFGHGLHYTNFSAVLGGASFPSTFSIAAFSIAALLASCTEKVYFDRCPFQILVVRVTSTGSEHTSDYVALAFLTGSYGPDARRVHATLQHHGGPDGDF